jgi:hypothetical protein
MTTKTGQSTAPLGLWLTIAIVALGVSTSAQVRRNTDVGVTVFVNPNFSGQSASFRVDTPTLVSYGLNDKISSIQIPNGETWEVCQDINYANQCQVLTASVADLRGMGWNDRISSLRRVDNNGGFRGRQQDGAYAPGGQQQGILFYTQAGYRGTSRLVTDSSTNVGFPARQGSIQLRGGGDWQVCDSSGRCATVTQDVSDVSRLGLNGRIVSVRFIDNSPNGRGRGRGRGRGNGNGNGQNDERFGR